MRDPLTRARRIRDNWALVWPLFRGAGARVHLVLTAVLLTIVAASAVAYIETARHLAGAWPSLGMLLPVTAAVAAGDLVFALYMSLGLPYAARQDPETRQWWQATFGNDRLWWTASRRRRTQ